MIEAINTFTLSGVVYDNAIKQPLPQGNIYNSQFYTSFVLVVGILPKVDMRIPVICVGECADKALLFCRKGNYVVVQGRITAKEFVNKESGDLFSKVNLIGYQIMPLIKSKEKSLKRFNFRDVVLSNDPKNYSEMTKIEEPTERKGYVKK